MRRRANALTKTNRMKTETMRCKRPSENERIFASLKHKRKLSFGFVFLSTSFLTFRYWRTKSSFKRILSVHPPHVSTLFIKLPSDYRRWLPCFLADFFFRFFLYSFIWAFWHESKSGFFKWKMLTCILVLVQLLGVTLFDFDLIFAINGCVNVSNTNTICYANNLSSINDVQMRDFSLTFIAMPLNVLTFDFVAFVLFGYFARRAMCWIDDEVPSERPNWESNKTERRRIPESRWEIEIEESKETDNEKIEKLNIEEQRRMNFQKEKKNSCLK